MKKIVFDARMYGLEHAGIGRYIASLLLAISHLPGLRRDYQFHLLVHGDRQKTIKEELGDFYLYHSLQSRHYSFSEQWEVRRAIGKINPHLVHFPHFNMPIFYSGKYVVTIHDLIKHFFRGRQTTTRKPWLYWPKYIGYRFLVRWAIKKSTAVIVPTSWWKKKLVAMYPDLSARKIFVTWEGVGEPFLQKVSVSSKEKRRVLEKYGLKKEKFFIYTGSVYPHKNVYRLVKAFLLLGRDDLSLAIVCSRNVFRERLETVVSSLKTNKQIKFLGFVPDNELKILYQEAIAFVQPSLMEGFGLPGLEAMACFCPVISSKFSCLPEVYSKAAVYFDPLSPKDMVEKLKLLIEDRRKRRELIKLGEKRVEEFSWKNTAEETVRVYKKILKNE
jgi:glycosyltransferase involved in cell wall biosynthesis